MEREKERKAAETSELWKRISERQGEVFYTAKNLPFTYTVKGGELFTDRRARSITRSTFERAYKKISSDKTVTGPKKLNMYGAPYVFAILKRLGVEPGSGGFLEENE